MNYPKVIILILTWNGLDDSRECLDSLKKISYPNYSVLVVDNGSKINEAETLKREYNGYLSVIRNNSNLGFAEGNNVGIRDILKNHTEVKYIFLLNNDTKVEMNLLEPLVQKAEEDAAVGMVASCMMNYYDHQKVDSLGIELTRSGLCFNIKDFKKQPFCPCGGAALYSTELLKDIALNDDYFDADFFCTVEDLDIGFRAHLKGYRCKRADESIVYHKVSKATGGAMSDRNVYYCQRNTILYIIKNFPTVLLIKYGFWMICAQIAMLLLYLKRKRIKIILNADFNSFKLWKRMSKKRLEIQKNKNITNKELDREISPYFFPKEYLKNLN